jgi:hypothetical protein
MDNSNVPINLFPSLVVSYSVPSRRLVVVGMRRGAKDPKSFTFSIFIANPVTIMTCEGRNDPDVKDMVDCEEEPQVSSVYSKLLP